MKNEAVEIDGNWPDLEDKRLQQLLAQECWYQKNLEEEANVVLIKAEGGWHHLYFDMGTLFCRMSQDEPQEITPVASAEISYHLKDLGADLDLAGRVIQSCTAKVIPGGSEVELAFEGGKKICFKNIDNLTRYEVI